MARCWAAISIFWAIGIDASEPDRFSIRRADAAVVERSADSRFAVDAVAELRLAQANPPRFTLKSTTATCSPLPDALFQNGFE